ncbi:DUF4135 domain-containing protein [Falsiroseomonas sp.]|uniref:DUF4135 domain-containing protein n=1 Tax=Falsiroseomonas sp. TaxID=2870721 RepID=UPI003F6F973A
MSLSASERARLAAAASWPAERDAAGLVPVADPLAVAHHLAQWRQHVAKGDVAVFERVLRWRGLDPAQAAARLAPVRLADQARLPDWINTLAGLLAPAQPAILAELAALAEGLPHAALLAPIVAQASRAPLRRLRALGAAPAALAPLQRDLLRLLGRMAGEALAGQADAADPLRQALLAHPVLARLMARCCANWTAALTEMLDRLAEDAAILADFLGTEPGPPEALETTDADPHDGGRMVVLLRFADHRRVVYKPRDLRLDLGFAVLLRDLCGRGLDLEGAVPRCLPRQGYGWVAFITHRHAADAAELARFWTRAGQLLGVLCAIGGTDMHAGNVIAAGDRLVLIDLETVLSPALIEPPDLPPAGEDAVQRLGRLLVHSPQLTAMLPLLYRGTGERVSHYGAFGSQGEPGATHRATPGPIEAELRLHHATIEAGFLKAMRVMREAAPDLTGAAGALAALAPGSVRLLFRDSRIYAQILRSSFQPACLADGAAWDVHLEQLARMLAPFAAPPRFAGLVAAEKRALAELDIPRFDLVAEGTDLRDRQGVVVAGIAPHGPLANARRRLARLAAADEDFQRRAVGMALQLRILGHRPADPEPPPAPPMPPLAGALAIARSLRGTAVAGHDGSLTWHCPRHDVRLGAMELLGFNFSLADGTLGIAVFLAALAAVQPSAETLAWRDGALAALRPTGLPPAQTSLAEPQPGLLEGIGGEAWGHAALARLGGPAWCADRAQAQAGRLLDLQAREPSLGTGLAGAVLAVLAVHRLDPARLALAALAPLLRRLESRSAEVDDAGLVTGRAGIALALRRAARAGLEVASPAGPPMGSAPVGGGWGRGALGVALAQGAPPDAAMVNAAVAGGDGLWRGRAGLLMALDATGQKRAAAALAGELAGQACAGALRPVLPALPGVVMPGLCNGVAGIGYALLRHLRPDLPDLALFD